MVSPKLTPSQLHMTAAFYPDSPSEQDKRDMKGFIRGIRKFYPCEHCRIAFDSDCRAHPPRVESREALVVWMCERHNEVNRALGKPEFECSVAALDERWKDGHSECWQQKLQSSKESLGHADDDDTDDDSDGDVSGNGRM